MSNIEISSIHSSNTSEEESDILASSVTSLAFTPENDSEENKIYDCIVIGSGVSGLNCAHKLHTVHGIPIDKILIVDAQSYVGGRIKQNSSFIKGAKIELGAEILHGSDTLLTQYAKENNWPLQEIYCWAHGDGGPGEFPVNGGYGLYYFSDGNRLLRYDEEDDKNFIHANDTIWDFDKADDSDMSTNLTLEQYMISQGVTQKDMLDMVSAGYSNTFCSETKELCMKKCIAWCRVWDSESPTDQDYKFKDSFSCLIDYLKKGLNIKLNQAISSISYQPAEQTAPSSPVRMPNDASFHTDTSKTPSQDNLVHLTAVDGTIYTAKTAVVSASLHVMKSGMLTFQPPLEKARVEALNSCNLKPALKIYLKFSKRCWPKGLTGMIMSGEECVCPEVWFRDVSENVAEYNSTLSGPEHPDYEHGTCYATGFATATFAENLIKLGDDGAVQQLLKQLQKIFAQLNNSHMTPTRDQNVEFEQASSLPRPMDVFLGGTTQHWTKQKHPYIGGGFSSPIAGGNEDYQLILSTSNGNLFFCGEATSQRAGGTAHAALETGVKAAAGVAKYLSSLSASPAKIEDIELTLERVHVTH